MDVAIDFSGDNSDYTCFQTSIVHDSIVFVLGTHWMPASKGNARAKEAERELRKIWPINVYKEPEICYNEYINQMNKGAFGGEDKVRKEEAYE